MRTDTCMYVLYMLECLCVCLVWIMESPSESHQDYKNVSPTFIFLSYSLKLFLYRPIKSYHVYKCRALLFLCTDACDLTLDPTTAHNLLILSGENKKVTCVEEEQSYPDHPERFLLFEQVMCKESLSERCYWEVEWKGWSHISVTYKGIRRHGGTFCRFGLNQISWNLYCCDSLYSAWHNFETTDIPALSPLCNKVGVYVDWCAGTLSFYTVSDTHGLTHLHTFHSTFTERLYAGFGLYHGSTVSLC